MRNPLHTQNAFRRDTRGVSPAISTVIITSAVVVMILVTMVYTNNFLNASIAKNEFTTNKQFMLTAGLQIDDIAWTIGRTQTVRYTSRFADLSFVPQALTYSIETNDGTGWRTINQSLQTGIISFNMPSTEYTVDRNYYEPIFPSFNSSFVQEGPTAPVSEVYVIEKLPMANGTFTRVVIVPSIRMLNSTIGSQNYVKFYLPLLTSGESPHLSQSVTFIGKTVTQYLDSGIMQVRFKVFFPKADEGFNSGFFPFDNEYTFECYTATVSLPAESVVEFYVGEVSVSMGLYL